MRVLVDDVARARFARHWREEHAASGGSVGSLQCPAHTVQRAPHPVRVIGDWQNGHANNDARDDGFVGHLGVYRRG